MPTKHHFSRGPFSFASALLLALFVFLCPLPSEAQDPQCSVIARATQLDCNTGLATLSAEASSPSTFIWTGTRILSGANSATAVVNLTGTYTVTATDRFGCVSSATVLVRPSYATEYPLVLPTTPVDFKVFFSGDSYFDLQILNAPPGTLITNGLYESWCIKYDFPIETNRVYQGMVYDPYTRDLPLHMRAFDWARINYILNHRGAAHREDVQDAIWYFSGRPEGGPLVLNGVAQALVNDALANGRCFSPEPGDHVAVAIDTGLASGIQWLLLEVALPAPASIAVTKDCPDGPLLPGARLTFTGTVTNTGYTTLRDVYVVDDQPLPNTPVLGPITLLPGQGTTFSGSYIVPGATTFTTNGFTSTVSTNQLPVITTNNVTTVTTNISPVVTTNLVTGYTTNTVTVLTTNLVSTFATNTVATLTTNFVSTFTTNSVPALVTNLVTLFITNTVPVLTTNFVTVLTTNTVAGVTTNLVTVRTTNFVTVTVTNSAGTVTTNPAAASFSTINTVSKGVVDRFTVPTGLQGLTYADQDKGYAATQFYSMRKGDSGSYFFDTITASTEAVIDRFAASDRNFDSITFAAPDLGYGPVIFYSLSHNSAGVSTLSTIKPGGVVGVVADLFVAGNNVDSLTFAATDVGYGANLFYYVRRNAAGISTFGTINPALPGTMTDRFAVGNNVDALVFTATDVGYGANNFYYLRHNATGTSTFGSIAVTGLTSGTVTDRFDVGPNAHELTFTPTDTGFGPNLFYFLREGSSLVTNTVSVITTNITPVVTTETVAVLTTNSVGTITTNTTAVVTTVNAGTITSNTVPVITTNAVGVITTNTTPVITTQTVAVVTTNTVPVITTGTVAVVTSNSVPVLSTNMVTTIRTDVVPVFTTNSITVMTTNTVFLVSTNVVPTLATDTVTATGFDPQHSVTVTDTASCSVAISPLQPVVGGAGAPAVQQQNNAFSLSFATQLDVSYTVQYKDSLNDAGWRTLPNMPVLGTGHAFTITDAMARPMRFYRIILTP